MTDLTLKYNAEKNRVNQLIMDLMLRIDKVEKVGTGIKRIRDSMKSYGLKVRFESTGFFNVIFERLTSPQKKFIEKFGGGSEKSSEKIMELIKEDKTISGARLAEVVGISQGGVEKQIAELKKKLKRIGPDKGGHWEVSE